MNDLRKLVADNVMSEPVFYVDENDLVKVAVDKMKKEGTKKILVKSTGKPVGVLERWKITDSDLDLKVGQIQPLGKIKVVPRGTDMSMVEDALLYCSAVYVSEPNDPNEIVGVVTAYDLVKAF